MMSAGKPKVPFMKAIGISATMVGLIMLGMAMLQRQQLGDDVAGMAAIVGGVVLVFGILMLAGHALTARRKD
jgi:hypothetical protein